VIENDIDAHCGEDFVVKRGGSPLKKRIAGSAASHGIDNFIAFLEGLNHLWDCMQVVLQVGIETDDRLSLGG
jgi:hypothetical protein